MGKGDIKLKEGRGGQLAQIWVEEPTDNGRLTTGTVEDVTALWCNDDGTVAITFPGIEVAKNRTYVSGDMVAFDHPVSVAITTGTFSFMVA